MAALASRRHSGPHGADAEHDGLRFRLFAAMWAVAHIVHLWSQTDARLTTPTAWLTLAAAVWVLSAPQSAGRVTALAAAQLADVAWEAPYAPDHWVLVAAVNVVLLFATVPLRRTGITASGVMARAAPPAMVITLIAYSAAAVAKWNTTFLDPVTSCASFLAEIASFGLVGEVPALRPLHVIGAIVPETLIPILLMVPATRRYGVRFGILFHFLLSFSPAIRVADFSTALFALFLLFLPRQDVAAIIAAIRRGPGQSAVVHRAQQLGRLPIAGLLTLAAGAGGYVMGADGGQLLWPLVTGYGLILLWALARTLGATSEARRIGADLSAPQLALVLVFAVYALSPYVGLRTFSVFTMFSNLRTEGSGTNHLFMPAFDLFGLQGDLVEPIGSTNEYLAELVADGQAVPYFEVRRFLHAEPSSMLVAVRSGAPLVVGSGHDDPARDPPPYLLRKALAFRAVPGSGDSQCGN